MMIKKLIQILTMGSFIITALTSILLFIAYLKNSPAGNPFMTCLHVWAGMAFIILMLFKMINEKLALKK